MKLKSVPFTRLALPLPPPLITATRPRCVYACIVVWFGLFSCLFHL